MSKGIFITGTGTDVGKTFVSALTIKKLRESGLNAGYYKAALSGAEKAGGRLLAGDAEYVCRISGIRTDANSLVSYIYEDAVSPHLAARRENRPIEMEKLVSDFNGIKTRFEYVTVEGSGGIVCPLRLDEQTIMLADVIKAFALSVIIVSPSGLGAINSAVLTAEYAKSRGIQIKGIILNGYEHENYLHKDNLRQIELLTGVPVIGCISRNAEDCGMDTQTLADLYGEI